MSWMLVRKIGHLSLLNNLPKESSYYASKASISKVRGSITTNEKEWIKENNKTLIEKVKKESGIVLNVDLKKPQLFYEDLDEFKNADDIVKKILSLEFAPKPDLKRFEEKLVKKEFQRDLIDENSLEIQIALHTLTIKRMLNNVEESNLRNKTNLFYLYRAIHRRDRLMTQLFYKDHKRFEWLKEKLGLKDYTLKEAYPYRRQTKYENFVGEVKERAEKQRQAKLNAVREEFEREKKVFFQERDKILLEIQREIKELGYENIEFPKLNSSQA